MIIKNTMLSNIFIKTFETQIMVFEKVIQNFPENRQRLFLIIFITVLKLFSSFGSIFYKLGLLYDITSN